MSLSREQKVKRAELNIQYLTARIDRETAALRKQLKEAKEVLRNLEHVGYRVLFETTVGHGFGAYHDFTSYGWGSQPMANKHAQETADKHGGEVVDLYRDELEFKRSNNG